MQINIKELTYKCIDTLKNLGSNINKSDIDDIIYEDLDKDAGNLIILNKHKYTIKLHYKLQDEHKYKFLLCAIYHELCHIIQFNEVFDANILDFDTTTNEFVCLATNQNLLINTIFSNKYHTVFWNDIVKQVNSILQLNPPVKEYLTADELNIFLEEFFMKIPKRIKGPIIVTDELVSGITLDELDNYSFDKDSQPVTEAINNKMDHSYRKWLK